MEINADLMWPRKGRKEQRSVRIRRAGNVPEIALATHNVAPAVRMEGEGMRGSAAQLMRISNDAANEQQIECNSSI